MAGTIVADDLQHSTAGSVGTEYVVNGSAKAWVNFNGTGTIAARDSFNLSSLTDNGTGDYTVSYSSNMGNAVYVSMGSNDTITVDSNRPALTVPDVQTTSAVGLRNAGTYNNNSYYDVDPTSVSIHGDLA